jgi:GNAT superfamily N-acetyltransferase
MELATPFVVVAAAHPSLDGAVHRFCDALRDEHPLVGRPSAATAPMAALARRLEAPAPGITLAAMGDGGVIGLARIDRSAPAGPDLLIAVAAPWRRRGVATFLGRALVARAHATGVPRIVVHTGGRGTHHLRVLAHQLGFQVVDLGGGRLDLVSASRHPRPDATRRPTLADRATSSG